ncbi:MAG: penicillin acylase family protein [Gammaproteobacteria bacterium]|nr:penicillin acylase family protein [Gammaproteobacteria bacterium]
MSIIRGVEGELTVNTTASGLTRVQANTWSDAMFGLGFAHGRDRGAQIELMRTLAQGRVCERLTDNDQTLGLDRYFRRLGLAQDAERHFPELGEPYRSYIEAYAAGVNSARGRHYPWLYRLVTGRPEPFRAHDVLLLLKLAAYLGLAEGQRVVESFMQHALRRGVDITLLQSLCPALQANAADLLDEVHELPPLYPGEAFGIAAGGSGGSNAWVVSGARSASGSPLLANDPHLEVNRLPAVIYAAQVTLGDECVTGATLPGLPGFLSGRNRHLAWGVTYSCADTCDFFVEHLRGEEILLDGEHHRPDVTTQTIRRKHHADEPFVRMRSPSGILETWPQRGAALSWRWVGQGDGGLASLCAFTNLLRCRNVAEARVCMRNADLPTLHMVFADRAGDIAYQLVGAIPKRKQAWSGLGPAAGFDSAQGWSGLLDSATEHPAQENPASGFIAVTNDDHTYGEHPGISTCWLAAYRGERITELLQARHDFLPTDFQHMQFDVQSRQAQLFVEEYLAHIPDGAAKRLLRDWDCRYQLDSMGATLFERLHRQVVRDVFGSRFGHQWFDHVTATTGLYATLAEFFDRVLLSTDSAWLPSAGRTATFAAAIARVLGRREQLRPWGEVNQIMMNNLFFGGRLPAWTGMDRGPYPLPGNHATIYQGNTFTVGTRKTSFAPCYRMIADLAGEDLWSNYPGGPSESRFSSAYRTVVADWLNGTYRNACSG